jgi:D-lactate dehydrogenase (cytochrome)
LSDTVSNRLSVILGDRFSTAESVLAIHGRDESGHEPRPPEAVCFPESAGEVSEIVKICAATRTPVIPFGAGTSVEGQVLATQGGVSIDLTRMNRILAIRPDDLDVQVEAGVTRLQLEKKLEDKGLFFPIDPGADATLGGMASTRASGTNAVRYGTMRENVLALTAVLPDGRVIQTARRARKSSAGYDLTRLLVGSEGTLGVICDLTLRVFGLPDAMSSAVVCFDELPPAIATVIRTIQYGIPVARIELLDEAMVSAINGYAGLAESVRPTLMLEFHGSQASVEEQAREVSEIANELGGSEFRWATDAEEREKLWQARHHAYFAGLALRPGCRIWSTDVCVPISRLADCILETRDDIEASGLVAPLVGHAGDGNFHLLLSVDPNDAEEVSRAEAFHDRLVERALDMDGTCTGEHGVGIGKRRFLPAEHGEAIQTMKAIKQALDPLGIMNPGKIFLRDESTATE